MNKRLHIELTAEQRSELEQLIHTGNSSARKQTRARILLLSDRGTGQKRTSREVAAAVMCSLGTVHNIRHRSVEGGLASALDEKPRPGSIPKVTGEVEAKLVMLACSNPPEGYARWTLRLLARKMVELEYIDAIGYVTVREHLEKTNCVLGK